MFNERLEYEFAFGLSIEDISDFICSSYENDTIMWEWFPVGSQSLDGKDANWIYKEYNE